MCVIAGGGTLKPFIDEECSTLMIDSMYNIIDMRDIQYITFVPPSTEAEKVKELLNFVNSLLRVIRLVH